MIFFFDKNEIVSMNRNCAVNGLEWEFLGFFFLKTYFLYNILVWQYVFMSDWWNAMKSAQPTFGH